MVIKQVCKEIKAKPYNQFETELEIYLSRDQLKQNIYHIMRGNPTLWEYLDNTRAKLIDRGEL